MVQTFNTKVACSCFYNMYLASGIRERIYTNVLRGLFRRLLTVFNVVFLREELTAAEKS